MKFEDVGESVEKLFQEVLKKDFPELTQCTFKLIFRTKKQMVDGKYGVACLKKMNEFARFLSSAETDTEEGYDYAIIIDKNIYSVLDKADQYRILRHELRHCVVDYEKKDPYKTRGHSVEDFYEDIEIEAKLGGDPRWMERIGVVCESVYSKENEKKATNVD